MRLDPVFDHVRPDWILLCVSVDPVHELTAAVAHLLLNLKLRVRSCAAGPLIGGPNPGNFNVPNAGPSCFLCRITIRFESHSHICMVPGRCGFLSTQWAVGGQISHGRTTSAGGHWGNGIVREHHIFHRAQALSESRPHICMAPGRCDFCPRFDGVWTGLQGWWRLPGTAFLDRFSSPRRGHPTAKSSLRVNRCRWGLAKFRPRQGPPASPGAAGFG